jgi:hypothetical protein
MGRWCASLSRCATSCSAGSAVASHRATGEERRNAGVGRSRGAPHASLRPRRSGGHRDVEDLTSRLEADTPVDPRLGRVRHQERGADGWQVLQACAEVAPRIGMTKGLHVVRGEVRRIIGDGVVEAGVRAPARSVSRSADTEARRWAWTDSGCKTGSLDPQERRVSRSGCRPWDQHQARSAMTPDGAPRLVLRPSAPRRPHAHGRPARWSRWHLAAAARGRAPSSRGPWHPCRSAR